MSYDEAFYENIAPGASRSAAVVVPLVLGSLAVTSVLDVGCAQGAWLAAFQADGITDVFGIDGAHVDTARLRIPQDRFQAVDLTQPFALQRIFDLVLCLEVAEHLPQTAAPTLIHSLVRHGPAVLFSAAIPLQGGTEHVNEQWPDYWVKLFAERSYVVLDPFRRQIWANSEVEWWYSQNLLLFVSETCLRSSPRLQEERERLPLLPLRLVHPRHYWTKADLPSHGVRKLTSALAAALWQTVRKRL